MVSTNDNKYSLCFNSDDALIGMIFQGNDEATRMLVERYHPLCISLANKYRRESRGLERDDLVQLGKGVIINCIDTYRNEKGNFFSYAKTCIGHAMSHYAKAWLGNQNDYNLVSLDAPINDDSDTTYVDLLEDSSLMSSPKRLYELQESYRILEDDALLTKMEQRVLFLRLQELSYEKIAQLLNITVKAVDNILSKARAKLRAKIKK